MKLRQKLQPHSFAKNSRISNSLKKNLKFVVNFCFQLFEKAVSAFPVATTTEVYKLHKRFSEVEIDMTYRKIEFLQEEIKDLSAKTPQGEDGLSWPIGVNPPFQPSNRWEVINWDYFDSTHTLTCPGEIPKCEV